MSEKELKIRRRIAKAGFTRAVKAVQRLLDSNRAVREVGESFQQLKETYKGVQEKHEAYCETIEDDAEFDNEQSWMEECMKTFVDLQMTVNDFVADKASDETNETTLQNPAPVQGSVSCKLERPKLRRFSGDVREYGTFKSDFKHLIESRYEARDAIVILRNSLQGKAVDVIKGIGNDYDAAWQHLDTIYGDPRYVADAVIHDLTKFRGLKDGEDSRFVDFVHLVRRSANTLKECVKIADMDNSHMLSLVERKMSNEDRKLWFRHNDHQGVSPFLQSLLDWMSTELRTRIRASAPIRDSKSTTVSHVSYEDSKSTKRPRERNERERTSLRALKCWICKTNDHWIDECRTLISKTQEERFILMKENHACFACLKKAGKDHSMATCRRRKKCEKCPSFHHALLHKDYKQDNSVNVSSVSTGDTLLPILTTHVIGSRKTLEGNCLLDTGSQITLIRQQEFAEELELEGESVKIKIKKVGGTLETVDSKMYNFCLQSLDDMQSYPVQAVALEEINNNIAEVKIDKIADLFRIDPKVLHRGSGSIDVLVGADYAKLHVGHTVEKNNLVMRHTPLGWVVFGGTTPKSCSQGMQRIMHVQMSSVDLQDFWTTEGMGVCSNNEERNLINESCKKVGQQWEVAYPWQKDPNKLLDNKGLVEKMLLATEKKLNKNPEHAKAYDHKIKEMVEMGFARKLTEDELNSYKGPVHYISHHAIVRPERKTTPIRIVFNSSATYMGQSLNDYWYKGPDLLNDLFGVILRFREKEVALCADISKMYHRVRIPESDQHVHRFLWRDLQTGREPDVYVMQAVTFGDKPAPAMAQTALRRTAEEGRSKYPEAATVLTRDTYMDDICTSTETKEEACNLAKNIDKVLLEGGFRVKGWTSNVLLDDAESETDPDRTMLESLAEEKILGAFWNRQEDEFTYRVKRVDYEEKKLTKRIILSQVARIFDPIGFAAPFVVRAKIGIQKLWEAGFDWDSELPNEYQEEWKKFFKEMEELQEVTFERSLKPENATGKPTLVIFSDASIDAFGACVYLRWELTNGKYEVRFVAAKSRVAPLKQLTVPRLELQAAVLASRLYKSIRSELTIPFEEVVFMTDSMIALSWIKNRAKSFKMFVATRIGEIQSNTDPSQWRHIQGDMNVADGISRGLKANELKGTWQYGPDFLLKPKSEWPEQAKLDKKSADVEKEKRKEQSVFMITQTEELINCEKFSNWRRLVRVTSYVVKFVEKLKSKCKNKGEKSENADKTLTPTELEMGEAHLIRMAQKGLQTEVKEGKLKSLSPFIDDSGIVRVGGRVDKAMTTFEQKHPALLPYEHCISKLIFMRSVTQE